MRMVNKGGAVLTLLTLLLAPLAVANAQVIGEPIMAEPIEGFAGTKTVNAVPSKPAPVPSINAVSYDNTLSAPNFGFTSTDPGADWGDELFTTNTGVLSTMMLSIFNSGSSLGPLLTANIEGGVRIEISDTGQGLTPEECERLFTPYYTTKTHGTGLGLAIVQSVISDHRGRITVQSEKGKGATFRIELYGTPPDR